MTAPIDTFRGRFLPYCLIPLSNGRYLVTNRDYKPLGETAFVDYEAHPTACEINGLTPARISKLDYRGAADADGRIYLYNDGCVPTTSDTHWRAYAARLKLLARMELGARR